MNKLSVEDGAAHHWYRFVLSYPPHLVRDYVERFGLTAGQQVLDPFCGTGTTIVECKKLGIPSIGIEVNPMAHFASSVKADWGPNPEGLVEHALQIAELASAELGRVDLHEDPLLVLEGRPDYPLRRLTEECDKLLLAHSISPLPLHKTLRSA